MNLADIFGRAKAAAQVVADAGGGLDSVVSRVVVESNVSPPIELRPFAPDDGSSASSGLSRFLLELLAPKVTVDTAAGTFRLAPGGEPSGNGARNGAVLVALLGVAGLGVAALAVYGVVQLARGAK